MVEEEGEKKKEMRKEKERWRGGSLPGSKGEGKRRVVNEGEEEGRKGEERENNGDISL